VYSRVETGMGVLSGKEYGGLMRYNKISSDLQNVIASINNLHGLRRGV